MSKCPVHHHGVSKAKGCSHLSLGNFGKLFPELDPLPVNADQARLLGGAGSSMHDQHDTTADSNVPAGYTFFAQFVDHDITLDTTSDLHGNALSKGEIAKLPNLRSPTLDLDCVYGFGPEANPHLYHGERAPGRLREGNHANPDDVARSESGTALIGDPRNDENIFVSQMQLLLIRFHNKVYDSVVAKYDASKRFEEAQKIARHHYQYIVVHDFLRRICDESVFDFALKCAEKPNKYPLVYKLDKHGKLPMPVEFSGAAYRFGHTTVRQTYAANGESTEVDLFDERFGTEGFSSLPTDLVVDWRFLLEVDKCVPPQMTKAFDLKFPDELIRMPDPIVGRKASDDDRSLAFRNLLRGNTLSLPSGQDVAAALKSAGYPISLAHAKLKLSEVIPNDPQTNPFVDQTPLFYYLMREAEILGKGNRMGPVGSAIILEVMLGGLLYCESSFLSEKNFKPLACIKGKGNSKLNLADIVRYVNS